MKNTPNDFFSSGLALLLIGLKLTNQIDWSWWYVLAPIYMPAVFIAVGAFFVYVVAPRLEK